MKQLRLMLVVLMLALIYLPVPAQVFYGINAGGSDKSPVASLQVGYYVESNTDVSFFASYDQRMSLTQKANCSSWFGISGGISLQMTENSYLAPLSGYYYRYTSSDHTNLNGWDYGLGLKYVRTPVSLETYFMGRTVSVTIGWIGFTKK